MIKAQYKVDKERFKVGKSLKYKNEIENSDELTEKQKTRLQKMAQIQETHTKDEREILYGPFYSTEL